MEAIWFKSGRHRGDLTGELPVVVCLSLCWRDVADRFEQPMVVEPRHPFQRGQLHRFLGLPGRAAMDQLSFVEPVDRLGQGVVVAVALAAYGGLDTGLGQTFAVADRDVLRASVRVMDQAVVALDAQQRTDPSSLPQEFDLLQARLTDGLIDRLQSERDPARRARIYAFPQQFAGLRGVLKEFVDKVFSPSQFEERPLLRGVDAQLQLGKPVGIAAGRFN